MVDVEVQKEFILCARYGELDELKELAEKFGSSLFKYKSDFGGNTALHMASANGHLDLNEKNDAGNTALHWAALNGSLPVVKQLVETGADVLLKNNLGRTAFYQAKQAGHEEVAELLLEKIDQVENRDKENNEETL